MRVNNRSGRKLTGMCTSVLLLVSCAALACAAESDPVGGLAPAVTQPSVLPTPLSALIDAPAVSTRSPDQSGAMDKCQISISKSQFDYGRFNRSSLYSQSDNNAELVVGRQISLVNVVCSEPQRIELLFRAAADGDGKAFRFGDSGKVRLFLQHAQADGNATQLGQGDVGAPPTNWAERVALVPNQSVMVQDDRLLSRLSIQLEAEATVPSTALSPANAQHWSDSGQLQLKTH